MAVKKGRKKTRFSASDWDTDFTATLTRWLNRYLKRKLDELWRIYPPRRKAKDYAERNGCQICGSKVPRSELDVDHIKPKGAVPQAIFLWPGYITRYFSPAENLQGVCKPCHKVKTAAEKKRGDY